MHTSATRICSPDPEHISHIAARYKWSEPSRRPVLSYPAGSCCRALPIHCPHHPISELPRSKHIPPSSLPAHRSILAHDSYTSRAHIRRDGGLRLAPASLPSHSTMLLHTLCIKYPWLPSWCCSQSTSHQSASSRRTGDTTPCTCGSSSPLLFGVAFIRHSFHASPQRPARRRRPPPTPPAIGPMSMA